MDKGNERDRVREVYLRAWKKYLDQAPLAGIEEQVIDVILAHPEYHALLSDRERAMQFEPDPLAGEENPFLHMGLHLAIREQISVDRPPGIRQTYRQLLIHIGDAHEVEHRMMSCLAEALWEASQNRQDAADQSYLACLEQLAP